MRTIHIAPYDPAWPQAFEAIKRHLMPHLTELISNICHVGSTSVPGLAAKPILDINIIIPSYEAFPLVIQRLQALGYEHEGDLGVPMREAFRLTCASAFPQHYLYVCPENSPELHRQLLFRDCLRDRPAARDAYAALKQRLALQHPHDIRAYVEGKYDFVMQCIASLATVSYDTRRKRLLLIDQTLLPGETVILSLHTVEEMEHAIRTLQVRGAPAIGVAAAIGLAVLAQNMANFDESLLHSYARRLRATRPTAINLAWALDRMLAALSHGANDATPVLALQREAQAIWAEDIVTCRRIGEHGSALLRDGDRVLTHCNAGRLAAVRYGTALAPIYVASEQGKALHVFADETRPLLQGARLTAYELQAAGISVTLLCDNMAASLLQSGSISAVMIGADRVARNGDAANKIGSLGLSIAARHFGVPFYVCAPFSTIDFDCADGSHIPIEQRGPEEVTSLWYRQPMAPADVKVFNPAFDIVPAENITALVTERGMIDPRFLSN